MKNKTAAIKDYIPDINSGAVIAPAVGLGTYALMRGAAPLGYGTLKSLIRPMARMRGVPDEQLDESMERLRKSPESEKINRLMAALTGGSALLAYYRPNQAYGGLLGGSPRFVPHQSRLYKTESLFYRESGYDENIDWMKVIPSFEARSMFSNDPALMSNDYVRNMGEAIITDAEHRSGSSSPTIGSLYDSTVDKIRSKLTLHGVTSTGIKTMVANGTARLFTGALDAVVGLDDSTKKNLIDTGTWAGAITAILE